jgi:hypothetical protein
MPGAFTSVHIATLLRLAGFLLAWFLLVQCARVLVMLLRQGPLIGWVVSLRGVTVMFLHEPPPLHIWLNVFFPALVSGILVYIGLFTSLTPVAIPHRLLIEILVIGMGVLLTSTIDFLNALRDVRYPLWGEARLLQSIQFLHASWASVHFTPFGLSYLRDRFGSTPTDLLQAL